MSHSPEERAQETVDALNEQVESLRSAAEEAREEAEAPRGETEEEYRDRVRSVPGIFGDIDTTAGAGASGTDVVSAQNEVATQFAAATEAKADEGDEEAQDLSYSEGRRQADVSNPAVPSAEQVDAGASDASDEEREENPAGTQEDVKAQAEAGAGDNTKASDSLGSNDDDAEKKSSRRGGKKS